MLLFPLLTLVATPAAIMARYFGHLEDNGGLAQGISAAVTPDVERLGAKFPE